MPWRYATGKKIRPSLVNKLLELFLTKTVRFPSSFADPCRNYPLSHFPGLVLMRTGPGKCQTLKLGAHALHCHALVIELSTATFPGWKVSRRKLLPGGKLAAGAGRERVAAAVPRACSDVAAGSPSARTIDFHFHFPVRHPENDPIPDPNHGRKHFPGSETERGKEICEKKKRDYGPEGLINNIL